MQKSDEPGSLPVGTEISAKFKGAFCEAKVKKVTKLVKYKVQFKPPRIGFTFVDHTEIKDDNSETTVELGATVLVPDKSMGTKKFVPAQIVHVKDLSTYVVVFNDGDERTLRRSQLCLKSGKHFSVNLDAMPLTNPEQFGSPVDGHSTASTSGTAKTGYTIFSRTTTHHHHHTPNTRRPRGASVDANVGAAAASDDDSCVSAGDSESTLSDAANAPEQEIKSTDYGRAVCVYEDENFFAESTSTPDTSALISGRMKPKWYPAMIVHASANATTRLTPEKNTLVRSFRDARYYAVSCRQCSAFLTWRARRCLDLVSTTARPAIEKALAYAEHNTLPPHWSRVLLLGKLPGTASDSADEKQSDGSGSESDYSQEERDVFTAQLYKYHDERDTPINRAPVLGGKDLNLFKLYRVVNKLGGYSRVCNSGQWKLVLAKMRLNGCPGANPTTIKHSYTRYLSHFDTFYRQLGWSMTNETGDGRRPSRGFRVATTILTTPHEKTRERHNSASTSKKPSLTHKSLRRTGGESLTEDDVKSTCSSTGGSRTPKRDVDTEGGADQPVTRSSPKTQLVDSFGPYTVTGGIRALYMSGAFKRWYEAKILKIEIECKPGEPQQLRRVFIHYRGWKSRFDEWLPPNKIKTIDAESSPESESTNRPKTEKEPKKQQPAAASTVDINTPNTSSNNIKPTTLPTRMRQHSTSQARSISPDLHTRSTDSPVTRKLEAARRTNTTTTNHTAAATRAANARTIHTRRASECLDDRVHKVTPSKHPIESEDDDEPNDDDVDDDVVTPSDQQQAAAHRRRLHRTRQHKHSVSVDEPPQDQTARSTPTTRRGVVRRDVKATAATRSRAATRDEPDDSSDDSDTEIHEVTPRTARSNNRRDVTTPTTTDKLTNKTTTDVAALESDVDLQSNHDETGSTTSRSSSRNTRVTRSRAIADGIHIKQWSRGNVLQLEDDKHRQATKQQQQQQEPEEELEKQTESAQQQQSTSDDSKEVLAKTTALAEFDDEKLDLYDRGSTTPAPEKEDQKLETTPVADDVKRDPTTPDRTTTPADVSPDKTPPTGGRGGVHTPCKRKRRRNQSHGWPDQRKTPKKEADGSEKEPGTPKDTLSSMKARVQSAMSVEDYDVVLAEFKLPAVAAELVGEARLSAMESKLLEIRDAYQDVIGDLRTLERSWKRCQEKRRKMSGGGNGGDSENGNGGAASTSSSMSPMESDSNNTNAAALVVQMVQPNKLQPRTQQHAATASSTDSLDL